MVDTPKKSYRDMLVEDTETLMKLKRVRKDIRELLWRKKTILTREEGIRCGKLRNKQTELRGRLWGIYNG